MQKLNQWLFCMLFWSHRVEIKVRWTDLLVYKVYLVFLSVISCEEGKALAESWNAAFMESSAKENQVMMRFLSHSFLCLSRFISLSRCWVIVWWFFWETWMSRWRLIQQMFSIWMMISPSYYWVSHLETFFQTLTEGVCSSVSRQISAGVMLVSLGFVTWRFVLMDVWRLAGESALFIDVLMKSCSWLNSFSAESYRLIYSAAALLLLLLGIFWDHFFTEKGQYQNFHFWCLLILMPVFNVFILFFNIR